jgi:hypothetical protein
MQCLALAVAAADACGGSSLLPDGTIYDSRDLLDNDCLPPQPFDAPYAIANIVGEDRWIFH